MLVTAAEKDPATADGIRSGLVAFCDRDLLPHATAEESTLYPVARELPGARLLVDGMLAEHRRIGALVDALRAAGPAARTAAVETWGSTARAATRARADTEILIMAFSELRIFVQVGAMAPSAIAPGTGAR